MRRMGPLGLMAASLLTSSAWAGSGAQIMTGKDAFEFTVNGEQVGTYLIDKKWTKPILWPLRAPGGAIVTRAWPMEELKPGGSKDHPHQRSAWFCHGDIVPEGIEIKQKVK